MPACIVLAAFLGVASWQATARNPFLDQKFYINPKNAKEFDASIATATGKVRENLLKMKAVPSAYWIDVAAKIRGEGTSTVEGILKDASSKSPPELVVFMWYDLPNRDCDALASNGEICCAKKPDGRCDYLKPGDCAEGIAEYKRSYVDPFVAVLKEYEGKVPVALVMEPDGLANLATNIAHPACGNVATQTAYKHGVRYAVNQLAAHAPSVSIYLDAAHGGWLGWENNLKDFMRMLKGLQLPWSQVRGFATNVANYQALGVQCPWCPDQGYRNGYCLNGKHKSDPCCSDPCDLLSQYNFGNNELNYAAGLVAAANGMLGMDAHVIIDTGRNGVTDQRQDCANWCNPRGAGTGVRSTATTANASLVDAYFWLKTPGESDGCSQTLPSGDKCPRFDAKCNSVDSLGSKPQEPRAPEAGHWFDFQVKQLAENAHFEPPRSSGGSSAACAAPGFVPQPPQPSQPSAPAQPSLPAPGGAASSGGGAAGSSGGSGGACAAAFQQCGGQGWSGPTCCQSGCTCSGSGGYYSQCTPPAGGFQCSPSNGAGQAPGAVASPVTVAPSTTAALAWGGGAVAGPVDAGTTTMATPTWGSGSSATAPPLFPPSSPPSVPILSPVTPSLLPSVAPLAPAVPASQCSVAYGQCGGSGWEGPTCCDSYCSCQYRDAGYSECVPAGGSGGGGKDIAIVMKDAELGVRVDSSDNHSRAVFATGMALGAAVPALAAFFAFALARLLRVLPRARRDGPTWSLYSWLPQYGLADSAPLSVEASLA